MRVYWVKDGSESKRTDVDIQVNELKMDTESTRSHEQDGPNFTEYVAVCIAVKRIRRVIE